MPDPIMYQEGAYVLLETNQPEQILTPAELHAKLKAVLTSRQAELPRDAQRFSDLDIQVQYLMETACQLDVGPGEFLQWYVVRLEK